MDKVLSTRIDEAVITLIDRLAYERRIPKKRVIEEAVRSYCRQADTQARVDVFASTSGAWQRAESPAKTVEQARTCFRQAMRW
ncbi:MAG: hypothetical protein A3K19_31810 [Lentisphaerae bacterium RIFOXYB12_FULL_65_16]|nr:MAG: hypothetical protein A3K18_10590 [Lentisphaerae bacterium RIFOXYA12_64_32]OGV88689.1 MAG: hypothetical protein A3K19_31810 [Lentisphaerae bacterium RIFOXYB12_FULL_65_16]